MSNISEEATDLLQTLKRVNKRKTLAGDYIDKRRVMLEYGYKQNGKELDDVFKELETNQYITKENGAYRLLAKALNQKDTPSHSTTIFSGSFSNSNIANNSPGARLTVDLSTYSIEIQNEVNELREALQMKDNIRAKRIIDGLLVSAPQLLLTIIQIGMAGAVK